MRQAFLSFFFPLRRCEAGRKPSFVLSFPSPSPAVLLVSRPSAIGCAKFFLMGVAGIDGE